MTIQRDLYIQRAGLNEEVEEIVEELTLEEMEALVKFFEEKEQLLEFEPVSMALGAAGVLGYRKLKKMAQHHKAKSQLKSQHKKQLQQLKKRYSGF